MLRKRSNWGVKITTQQERRQKYEALDKKLADSGDTQISVTDPDAKALRVSNNGTDVGYCIQAATDQKHKLFVHAEIGAITDKRELAPMALEVKTLLDLKHFNTLSDAGYSTGDQFDICKEAGVVTYSAPMPSTAPSHDCIPTAEFTYNKEGDYYLCPMGQKMHNVGNHTNRGNYFATIYKTSACKTCSIREDCTRSKTGRVIERSEYQATIDENRERVLANPEYYKLRQQRNHSVGDIAIRL